MSEEHAKELISVVREMQRSIRNLEAENQFVTEELNQLKRRKTLRAAERVRHEVEERFIRPSSKLRALADLLEAFE